ncbi:MAG: nitrilase-related carbon-nitrogen hydrolase [Nitrospinota bacterium]
MSRKHRKVRVAAFNGMPVLPMNKKATTEKACHIIEEAGKQDVQLVVFPEGFIPLFPNWSMDLRREREWSDLLTTMIIEGVEVPGEETRALGEACKKAGVYVCMGVNEVVPIYQGVLYNSLIFINPKGELIGHHRKLTPSHRERVLHMRGTHEDLFHVVETDIGRIGGLICYEHLQPLFKYSLMMQGEEIHCACWAGWPHFGPGKRSNKPVDDYASRCYALEAACFVVLAAPWMEPKLREKAERTKFAGMENAHWGFIGGSGVINPIGEYVAGPEEEREGLVIADIDLDDIIRRKCYIDPVGKDSRWDCVRLDLGPGPMIPTTAGFPKVRREDEAAAALAQRKDQAVQELEGEVARLKAELSALKKGQED